MPNLARSPGACGYCANHAGNFRPLVQIEVIPMSIRRRNSSARLRQLRLGVEPVYRYRREMERRIKTDLRHNKPMGTNVVNPCRNMRSNAGDSDARKAAANCTGDAML